MEQRRGLAAEGPAGYFYAMWPETPFELICLQGEPLRRARLEARQARQAEQQGLR
jgi:hypothetical protein